jgi:hypothetical protein
VAGFAPALLIASFSLPFIFSAMVATSYATSATAAYCAAPSFSASASELLQACKGLEAFRKGAQSSLPFDLLALMLIRSSFLLLALA